MYSFTWICPGNWFCGLIMCGFFSPYHLQISILLISDLQEKLYNIIFRKLMNLKELLMQILNVVGIECIARERLVLHNPLALPKHRCFIPLGPCLWVFWMHPFFSYNLQGFSELHCTSWFLSAPIPTQNSISVRRLFLTLNWSQKKLALGLKEREKNPFSLTQSYAIPFPKGPRTTPHFTGRISDFITFQLRQTHYSDPWHTNGKKDFNYLTIAVFFILSPIVLLQSFDFCLFGVKSHGSKVKPWLSH